MNIWGFSSAFVRSPRKQVERILRLRGERGQDARSLLWPGVAQEVAANGSQGDAKATTYETLIYKALFVAGWLQSRLRKDS